MDEKQGYYQKHEVKFLVNQGTIIYSALVCIGIPGLIILCLLHVCFPPSLET